MNIDFKNKKELTFLAAGILILIILLSYSVWIVRFAIKNLNVVFQQQAGGDSGTLRFHIQEAESILGKK